MRPRFAALAALTLLAVAPAASASVAPGIVTAPVSTAPTAPTVDPFAATVAALLPGGGIVTAGVDTRLHRLVVGRFTAAGAPDASFGRGGVASLAIPSPSGYVGPIPHGIALDGDGRVLVATEAPDPTGARQTNLTAVTRLLANGRPDPAFGTTGTVITGIRQTASLAVQDDGRPVVCGATGAYGPPGAKGVPLPGTRAWSCTRLNLNGATDTSFGSNSVATLPGQDGTGLAMLAGGRIAATGTTAEGAGRLAVLRQDGTADPGFNGGSTVVLPAPSAGRPVAHGDRVDVITNGATGGTVGRYRADGTLDPSFGTGGAVQIPGSGSPLRLTPGPNDADLVVGLDPASMNRNLFGGARITWLDVNGNGATNAWGPLQGVVVSPAFGGGYGTFRSTIRLPNVTPLAQDGFSTGAVLARADGGVVLAGSAAVIQYTGEGAGVIHDEIALAAFGPSRRPDAAFGGPARAATLRARVPAQRIRTIATRRASRAVRADLTTSGPGLARIDVRGRGRLLARTTAPVYRAGSGQHALVYFTAAGRRLLTARAHHVRVSVTVTFRDLVQQQATATAQGVLR